MYLQYAWQWPVFGGLGGCWWWQLSQHSCFLLLGFLKLNIWQFGFLSIVWYQMFPMVSELRSWPTISLYFSSKMIVGFPLWALIFICHIANLLSSLCLFFLCFAVFLSAFSITWFISSFSRWICYSWSVLHLCLFLWGNFLSCSSFSCFSCLPENLINCLHLSNSAFINGEGGRSISIPPYSSLEVHELLSWLSCVLPVFFGTISGKVECPHTTLGASVTVAERYLPGFVVVVVVVQLHNITHQGSPFIINRILSTYLPPSCASEHVYRCPLIKLSA